MKPVPYEWFIGKRYLISPRKDRSVSVITWISVCGVALGVIALIVATSLMNGFRDNLRQAITGSLPHVTLFSWADRMTEYPELQPQILQHPEVKATAPYIFKQALLTGTRRPKGALLRGIDPAKETQVTNLGLFLRQERYHPRPPTTEEQQTISDEILARLSHLNAKEDGLQDGIILGSNLAQQLGVQLGDTVQLVSSEQRMTPVGDVPRIKKLMVIGFFESGIAGYDEVLAFMDYRLVQKVYRMQNDVTGLGVRLRDPETAQEVADELRAEFTDFAVSSWIDENKSIFQVMQLEKIGLFVILTLIVVVAAFNIVSSLIMLVLEKSREIAILKAVGATEQSVRKIFMLQGVVIGLIGTCSGVGVGLTICWALATFNFIDIPPGVYPGGDKIPVLVNWTDVLITTVSSFLICFLVTIYPSTKAARLQPADSLRYE
ncbi:MAG: lipoprotein-releasing system transmembrane subunit LolC [Deltaproteobacteria bacterium]|nr:lipoprotein-releasing system transmembrane subunit LolC [Deltaproteobacteria bacterium]